MEQKQKAVWTNETTIGPNLVMKVSDKGAIGIFRANGQWVGLLPGGTDAINGICNAFTTAPESLQRIVEVSNQAYEESKPRREYDKAKAYLEREQEKLAKRAADLQRAADDLNKILAEKAQRQA